MAKRGIFNRTGRDVETEAPVYTGPRAADLTVGDYATGMPNVRIGEMIGSFGRQLPWLIPALLIGSGAAWYATKDFKRSYVGEGKILVQLGPEYIFESVTSDAPGSNLLLTPDHIVLNEIAIMKNSAVMDAVIGQIITEAQWNRRFAGDDLEKVLAPASTAQHDADWMALRTTVENSFVAAPKPKSSIVELSYKHEDGEVAVEMLRRLILEYEAYRRIIFVEGSGDAISERRIATEEQLGQNERAIQRFLQKNDVSDFVSERGGVQKRTEELRAVLNTLRGEMSETEAGLATVENQLRNLPANIDLYVDDRAAQRVAQAELELKQLLAKYLPGSKPVQQKQGEIEQLRSLQASNNGNAVGGRRVGPNPVYQELLTRRNILQSTADSYREKEYTLQRQLDSADAKVRRLQTLSPAYQSLLRERDTLDSRLKSYTTKEQEALVNQQQAETNSENVKVIEWPTRPRKGRNMRLVAFALATIGWGFALFMLAMLRVFTDPRLFANPGPRRSMAVGMPESEIPEPVAPYAPQMDPMIVPAAAVGAHASYDYDLDDDVYGGTQSIPAADMQPAYTAQSVATQDYAGAYDTGMMGSTAQSGNAALDLYDNPYLSGASAGSLDQQLSVSPQELSETNEYGLPVLGTVPPAHQE